MRQLFTPTILFAQNKKGAMTLEGGDVDPQSAQLL
jgi:hypothetical protein